MERWFFPYNSTGRTLAEYEEMLAGSDKTEHEEVFIVFIDCFFQTILEDDVVIEVEEFGAVVHF